MSALSDDLLVFARAIVRSDELSPQVNPAYLHYPASTAIEVYRNNYRANLHDTLAGAYPVIEQLVGKEFFQHLAHRFIEQHPSHSGNLHRYGEQLADFLGDFEPAQGLVYLPDIAALEWACHCAYFADDAAMLDIAKLAQISPGQYADLILLSHPACHLVCSSYPIAQIWQAHQPGAELLGSDDFHIDLDGGPCRALVTRRENRVQVSQLQEANAEWLASVQAGIKLGVATANTLEKYPDFDLLAGLANLFSQGVFTDFNLEETI